MYNIAYVVLYHNFSQFIEKAGHVVGTTFQFYVLETRYLNSNSLIYKTVCEILLLYDPWLILNLN
jgi:hypothetical protein